MFLLVADQQTPRFLLTPGSGVVSPQQPGEAGPDSVLPDRRGGGHGHLCQRGETLYAGPGGTRVGTTRVRCMVIF